jgi:hypothetical protein
MSDTDELRRLAQKYLGVDGLIKVNDWIDRDETSNAEAYVAGAIDKAWETQFVPPEEALADQALLGISSDVAAKFRTGNKLQ